MLLTCPQSEPERIKVTVKDKIFLLNDIVGPWWPLVSKFCITDRYLCVGSTPTSSSAQDLSQYDPTC